MFTKHISPQGSVLLNNSEFKDEEYVYIKNETGADKESLNGLGRQYSIVGLLNKELRNRLFEGFTEIDIDCAVQTVMMNLFMMNTKRVYTSEIDDLKFEFPEFYGLFNNKNIFRSGFGKSFDTGRDEAKTILTHLTYSPKSNVIHTYCKDKSPKVKFNAKEKSKKFIKESVVLRNFALEKLYYQTDENKFFKIGDLKIGDIPDLIDEEIRVNNTKLKGNGRGKTKEDRIMFRIYELIEHQIRKVMVSFVANKNIREIYQIHDCLIFKGSVHIKDLESYIKEKLNLEIKLTSTTLGSQS